MEIKMLKTHADASGAHLAGKIYNLPNKEAKILIKAGAAKVCPRKSRTNGSSEKNSTEAKKDEEAVKILTSVSGIGKVTATELVEKGITTLEQLAKANLAWSEDAAEMIKAEKLKEEALKGE